MKIYRVEIRLSIIQFDEQNRVHATNIGPYSCSLPNLRHVGKSYMDLRYVGWFNFSHRNQTMSRHPAPQEDELLMRSMEKSNERYSIREFHFGFPSLWHVRNWFDIENREIMHDAGFFISEYDVPEDSGHIGKSQAIFRMDKATLVRYHELTEI